MAIIRRFAPVTKDRVGRPKDCDAGYAGVDIDGTPYLLLETYGSSERAKVGGVSQSIHLDRDAAIELKRLLEQRFPGI